MVQRDGAHHPSDEERRRAEQNTSARAVAFDPRTHDRSRGAEDTDSRVEAVDGLLGFGVVVHERVDGLVEHGPRVERPNAELDEKGCEEEVPARELDARQRHVAVVAHVEREQQLLGRVLLSRAQLVRDCPVLCDDIRAALLGRRRRVDYCRGSGRVRHDLRRRGTAADKANRGMSFKAARYAMRKEQQPPRLPIGPVGPLIDRSTYTISTST